jgi:hypothetical protein
MANCSVVAEQSTGHLRARDGYKDLDGVSYGFRNKKKKTNCRIYCSYVSLAVHSQFHTDNIQRSIRALVRFYFFRLWHWAFCRFHTFLIIWVSAGTIYLTNQSVFVPCTSLWLRTLAAKYRQDVCFLPHEAAESGGCRTDRCCSILLDGLNLQRACCCVVWSSTCTSKASMIDRIKRRPDARVQITTLSGNRFLWCRITG